MNKMDEQILVIQRGELFDGIFKDEFLFQGLETHPHAVETFMCHLDKYMTVMRRGDAEENPNFKQPIPYVVIRRGDHIFLYKRLSGGGEARLHDKFSIGVGGHMNEVDAPQFAAKLAINMYREMNEELVIASPAAPEIDIVGFINDDSSPVSEVHIGILVTAFLPVMATVAVRETEQLEGEWVHIEDLLKPEIFDRLESWSQIAAKELND